MKKYLFIPFLILAVLSCEEKKIEIPPDILPADKMVSILIDIHLVEGSFSQKNLPRDTAIFLFREYEKDLFLKHKISDSTYRKSLDFYSAHPALMEKIYEQVVDSLSLREGQRRL